jgi:hypothetical protein
LIETSCTILDLNGVGLGKARDVYGYLHEASKIGQNYYPERMGNRTQYILTDGIGKFYLINAPWGFSTVWAFIKGWLDPVTVSKIAILGSNYQPTLLQQIPAENLPSQFGGKCRCEGGCELSDEGPWQDPQWLGPQGKEKAAAVTAKAKEPADVAGKPEVASTSSGSTEPVPVELPIHAA